ncbi:hypothetical protein GCM10028781_35890 [Nostocoides australiense]
MPAGAEDDMLSLPDADALSDALPLAEALVAPALALLADDSLLVPEPHAARARLLAETTAATFIS